MENVREPEAPSTEVLDPTFTTVLPVIVPEEGVRASNHSNVILIYR